MVFAHGIFDGIVFVVCHRLIRLPESEFAPGEFTQFNKTTSNQAAAKFIARLYRGRGALQVKEQNHPVKHPLDSPVEKLINNPSADLDILVPRATGVSQNRD